MKIARTIAAAMLLIALFGLALNAQAQPGPAGIKPTPEPPTPTATATPTPKATPTATPAPPTPTAAPTATATPAWDKSSLEVDGRCSAGKPEFIISNHGATMQQPAPVWLLNEAGGASTCAADIAAGFISTDTVQIDAGRSITLVFDVDGLAPPYRLCVAQAAGHPGTGYASATIDEEAAKECDEPTALDGADEPSQAGRLYLPSLTR